MSAASDTPAARSPWALRIPAALIVLLTCAHLAYYFPRVVDDLFISLRFAENLAHGRGAVYNVGERVEGYSGPLWMLLQSVGFLLRIDGVTWTKLLGLASLLAAQYGLYRLTRDVMGVRPALAWAPCVFLAANSYALNWATLGLETPLHLAALTLCPVGIDAFLKRPTPRNRRLAVAGAVLLGSKEAGSKHGLKPRAKIRAFANIGSEPAMMLTGPVDVTEKLFERSGMKKSDIDLFELNEAFASVVLRYIQAFDIDNAKINVNGGAIALGHPLGATGAMILGTVLDELERTNKSTALVTLCIGGGMGTATIIERV